MKSILAFSIILHLLLAWSTQVLGQYPPNIILIMADDLGSEAVGCYGGTSYQTPVLDELARTGVQFNHAYAYPLCTPTRVSLMTGQYNFRNWKAFGILDPAEETIGHLMQRMGYTTCMVGKWQLQSYDPLTYPGAHLRRNTGMKVENAGFDDYCMWHTGHTEDKGSRYPDPLINQNGTVLTETNGQYGPDIFTEYLNDFVNRNRHQPFFVYYPMALPHNPFVPTPDSKEWQDPTLRHKGSKRFFGDMVEYTDKLVGKIVDNLDKAGLRENTLIIFYSDNGTNQQLQSNMGETVIRGGKGLNIDAGTRVPLIVNWPGTIEAGQLSDEMIAPSDFLPTILDAIRRPLPQGFETDGQSFFPQLIGETTHRREWVLIDHNPRPGWDKENLLPARFVKGPRYKLYEDGKFVDCETDALEQHPLGTLTAEQEELHQRYAHILDSLRKYRTIGYLEKLDPAFDEIVPPHTRIEVIAEGFVWSEGPVWVADQQCLLFSDVPRNTIFKWTDTEGLSKFLSPSGYTGEKIRTGGKGSNGLCLDRQGRLLLCRHGDRELARLGSSIKDPHPLFVSLAHRYEGKLLNSPNDLTVDREGNIYFTDPDYGMDKELLPASKELNYQGVYRLSVDGELRLLTKALPKPNGIALSPDEQTLYVANSTPPKWMAYDLDKTGNLSNERIFLDAQQLVKNSISHQNPDGLKVRKDGTIFATGPDGILIFTPEGKHLGTIKTDKHTSNCAFNEDETVLYVTCHELILRIVLGYKLGFD
ncbi:MAG: sulfatase-like hydrolase/transferase [Bacteroidota bacterium]